MCTKVMTGKANYAASNMGFLIGKRVRCKRGASGVFECSTYKARLPTLQLRSFPTTLTMRALQLGICMQDVGVNFAHTKNRESNNPHYLSDAKAWAKAAEPILMASPNGLPPADNQCQSSPTPAQFQQVDSKTLTENVMTLA